MNVYEAIKTRRSIRSYEDRPVEEDKLHRILEAARLAPSASNLQEWRFVVVRDAHIRKKLMEAAKGQRFVGEASVVIACCAKTDQHVMTCGQMCYPIDVAIAIDHMTLAAVEEGLGTCWIGAFFADQVREILGIPENVPVVELLTLGYPASVPGPSSRLPFDTIIKYERWSD
ncbi:MAG: nitroreductase [candidate division Zixibacteria bacterium SM23_81]|nr:MAG: nitroreductase [candidate division Zixibacteria bacterium SM23_81]